LGTDSGTWMSGVLDEVAIYNKVLTPQRISAHYAAAPLPAPPSSLAASAISASQINLTWTDNASNETGFNIERSLDNVNFLQIGTAAANTTSYSDTGLTAGTTYYYRVQTNNTTGSSEYSNVASVTTLAGPPAAPTALIASAASGSQINLAWTDNANNESGFKIEQSTDNASFLQVVTVAANVTSYSVTGLTPATVYYFRVRAASALNGDSAYSNTASDTTSAAIPAAPSALTAGAVSTSQINLSWTDHASNEDGFKIERSADNVTFTQIATTVANITSYSDLGLAAGSTYYYRVLAHNTGGESNYSNIASATTNPIAPTPPAAPTALSAGAISSTQINLTWTDNANNEDGFHIERSTDNLNFSELNSTALNIVSYSDVGLTAGSTYYYRVRAYNVVGNSGYTNTVVASTQGATPTYRDSVVADAPVSYWRLGESSGTVAADLMGRNPGSYTGGFTLGQAGSLPGDPNIAVLLNGTSGYVQAPNSTSLGLGDGPLTLEAWVKRNSVNRNDIIIHKGTGAYQMLFTTGNRLALAKANTATIVQSNRTVTDTAWHHVVATKNGAVSKLYIDGVDVTGTITNQTLVNATSSTLRLGTDSGTWMSGVLDEVAIYNKVLTPQRISAHYAAAPLPAPPS